MKELKIQREIETVQNVALMRSARILRRVWEKWGNLLSLGLKWRPPASTEWKLAKNETYREWNDILYYKDPIIICMLL